MTLQVKNGSFSYEDTVVLKDVSFGIKEGEIMTVLGPNGAGKTTLLKCVMDFLHWDSGETLIENRSLRSYTERELWRIVSYVPQARQSIFSYRVLDMVVMGLDAEVDFFHIPGKRQFERARETLKRLGVEYLEERYCRELSGGELQMVMLARALVSKPRLLILDEPESNLDMRNQLHILNTIERAAKEMKVACLINTHFPNHALNISDYTLLLGHGQKQRFGPAKEVITENRIEEFFHVHSKLVSFEADGENRHAILPYKLV